jgi:hypothetical protein
VPVGLFGGELNAQIVAYVFAGSKASWTDLLEVPHSYQGMPDFSEFFEILHPKVEPG